MHQSGLCTFLTRTFCTDLVQSAASSAGLMPAITVRVLILIPDQLANLDSALLQCLEDPDLLTKTGSLEALLPES